MQKLLIADSSEIFMSALQSALGTEFQVRTCANGHTLKELLCSYQPDILILNLLLPYVDGLTVLQESPFRPSLIMAVTMHMSAYVEHAVTELGVDYTLISPSVESVVLRLQDLQKQYAVTADNTDLDTMIAHHLHRLNFQIHLDGYRQLCLALPIFTRNPQQLLTKELYPAVAKLCGCKDGRNVEHSIRKAIQAAWRQRDNAIWRKYFAGGMDGGIPCPSNKEFICRLAEILNAQNCLP